ncbi:MAG: hypothetical protein MJ252_21920 [archaeon]|nr:hypothetical protein [archaeon]
MKIQLRFELMINNFDKKIFVFKLEQLDNTNKKSDIRNICQRISKEIFDKMLIEKLDMFFFLHEALASQRFKIFFYLFCSDKTKEDIQKNIFKDHCITEVKK